MSWIGLSIALVASALFVATRPAAAEDMITIVDDSGDVGEGISMVLDANDHPVIAYYDLTNADLKLAVCGDATCSAGNTIRVVDSTGDVGRDPSLALDASGFPVVSYYDQTHGDLKVLRCGDATCETGNTITSPDTLDNVGTFSSLALDASGFPVVSYYDFTHANLKVLHCGDATCNSGNIKKVPDSVGAVGRHTSIALDSNGFPVVAYHDQTNTDLKILRCGDAVCGSGNVITTGGLSPTAGWFTSLELDADDFAIVSHYDFGLFELRLLACGDLTCASRTEASIDPDISSGQYTSLELDADGYPVISLFEFEGTGDLRVVHCQSRDCLGPPPLVAEPDTSVDTGLYTSLQLDSNGNPVVAYKSNANEELRLLACDDPDCGGIAPTPTPTPTPTVTPSPPPTPDPKFCNGLQVTIDLASNGGDGHGTDLDDVIRGTSGDDSIRSGAGNDTICGGSGDDIIRAGPGDDWVAGEAGADEIRGGGGHDAIFGGDGDDVILGQGGLDNIEGGPGDDAIDGLGAADTISGGDGTDVVNGQNGADVMVGGAGDDVIKGQTGPDTIDGREGDDQLFGGNGADVLLGGTGTDRCAGNLGPDQAEAATCEQTFGVESLF